MSADDATRGLVRRLEGRVAALASSGVDAAAIGRIEELVQRINHELHHDVRDGIWTAGGRIAHLESWLGRALDDLRRELEAVQRGQAQITREAIAAAARDVEAERLLAELAPRHPRRPGLSIVTISWNHGELLPASVRSGLALLDALPADRQGEVWILDDASTDDTTEVVAALGADARVHHLRAAVSLGLSRARDLLLHAVPTRHALVLDADNTVLVDAAALLDHAETSGAAFTFGPVLLHQPDGTPLGMVSAEPPGPGYVASPTNSIDTMAVVDVDEVLAAGGYTRDPVLAAADDWELVHRLAHRGRTIGFVPRLVGRYRAGAVRHSTVAKDDDYVRARITRAYRDDGVLLARGIDVAVALPDVEVAPSVDERRRVVVVSGGGVANVGDDAILQATVHRLAAQAPPGGWAIDLVTDGPDLPPLASPAAWVGTLAEVAVAPEVLDLQADDLVVLAGGGGVAADFSSIVTGRRAVVDAAVAAGATVVASGQGVGPLTPGLADDVRALYQGCARVAVRDPGSRDLLVDLGLDVPVDVVADDALALVGRGPVAPRPVGLPPAGGYLLVHAREAAYNPVDRERWMELAAAADALAADAGLAVLCLLINDRSAPPEAELASMLADGPGRRAGWHMARVTDDPQLAADLAAGCVAALVGSFHLGLFALAAGRPALVVSASDYFDTKAAGLTDLFGVGRVALTAHDRATEVPDRWEAMRVELERRAGERAVLAERLDAWWTATLSEVARPRSS